MFDALAKNIEVDVEARGDFARVGAVIADDVWREVRLLRRRPRRRRDDQTLVVRSHRVQCVTCRPVRVAGACDRFAQVRIGREATHRFRQVALLIQQVHAQSGSRRDVDQVRQI